MTDRKKILAVLRHKKSLKIVSNYLAAKNMEAVCVALDPVDKPEEVDAALESIKSALNLPVDAMILGTKVYESQKNEKADPPQKLVEFLALLKQYGLAGTPVFMTHLSRMPDGLAFEIMAMDINAAWVENDNLKDDGMANLGPLLMSAFETGNGAA